MNSIQIVGRIAKKGDLITTENNSMLNIRVAVDRNFKNSKGEKETDFIPVKIFGNLANAINDFTDVGRLVSISGRIQVRTYDQDGVKRYFTEIIANEIRFLDKKKKEAAL
ncbi:single-stranded DNA-binding protein [Clostridium sp. DL1XJH146]